MTSSRALRAHGFNVPKKDKISRSVETKCPKCPETAAEAVHALLETDLAGVSARLWTDDPSSVRWFVAAGAPQALERHGWAFRSWPDGRCWAERMDGGVPLPVRWLADCCAEGGALALADARGSYRAWLIAHRTAEPHLYPKDQRLHRLSSPPRAQDGDGVRLLRRLGYRTTRKDGPTRFVGVSLQPEAAPPARAPADGGGSIEDALAALDGMAADGRDLDLAHLRLSGERGVLCTRCGVMARRDRPHRDCPDVRARYVAAPVTTHWAPGMGGLAEEDG